MVDGYQGFSETSISTYKATRRRIPENRYLDSLRRENLESQEIVQFIQRQLFPGIIRKVLGSACNRLLEKTT